MALAVGTEAMRFWAAGGVVEQGFVTFSSDSDFVTLPA